MNKEHFLIELKIYLKPLTIQQQLFILEKYDALFVTRLAEGESEESITKSLGKPREIAKEILQEFHMELPEKKIAQNGWQEIDVHLMDREKSSEQEYYYSTDSSHTRIPRSNLTYFFQICGMFCLNFFFMIWMIFSVVVSLAAFWLTVVLFLLSPLLCVAMFFIYPTDMFLFQLFVSIFLFGLGLLALQLLLAVTKILMRFIRKYVQWNVRTLRRGI